MPLSTPSQGHFIRLLKLLDIDTKSVLDRYCRKLTIYSDDFARLITLAERGDIAYRHNMYHREIVPSDLKATLGALPLVHIEDKSPSEMSKLLRKLAQVVRVRRQLVGHVFYDTDVTLWHFFYFDQRDTSIDGNHWEYGSHVHLINHLSLNRDPVLVLKEFLQDKPNMRGSLHIRFVDKGLGRHGSLAVIR